MKKFIAVLSIVFLLPLVCACGTPQKDTLGVWWWNKELDAETYLDFATENCVTEIYYCDSAFDDGTADFIKAADGRGVSVYWLAGEYQWLSDSSSLYSQIARFGEFQSKNPDSRFAGIHLDIEPHQHPNFATERKALLESLISLVYSLKNDFPEIKFDYDIPFWIDDEITFDGVTMPAYAHVITGADRTFIMSYRDTAEKIYDVAKDEIEFASSVNKTLILGVETYSEEGDSVSFAEEGKQYMYGEIEKLRALLPENFGVSIHQIKTWHDLKN